jgi:poly-gamma-glutamate synthesis protein (capsule biosynthesis protein)
VLAAAGIGQAGMARRPEEIAPTVFDVAGVAVTHLSYTWSYNGLSLPEGEPWRSALIDPNRILADARRARDLGAEVVVVSLHWGTEKSHRVDRYQREVAEALTAAGTIDLIVGHHAHVLQSIEQVNGTWVLFGLGNVLSNLPTSDRWPAASQDAAVVTVTASVDPEGRVSIDRPVARATWVDRDGGWTVVLVDDELARDGLAPGHRAQLEASRSRTSAVLGDHLAPTSTPGR